MPTIALVGLVGTAKDHVLRKTIPLEVPEKTGCSGSADFGPLGDRVKELGSPEVVDVTFAAAPAMELAQAA